MTIGTNRLQISNWINYVFFSNFSQWFYMMHMNEFVPQRAIKLFKIKPTGNANKAVML